MPFDGSVSTQPRESKGLLRLGYPAALSWVLLAYAIVVVAIGSAYAASRIHADYEFTLQGERNRLRDVIAALQSGTLAMLIDGVGAAVAGANELQSLGGIARAPSMRLMTTLQKQLAGELVIPIARRVVSGENSPGWAGALFRFDGFDSLYRQFRDQILTMGLIASDGTILVRAPNVEYRDLSAGINVASNELFRRAADRSSLRL